MDKKTPLIITEGAKNDKKAQEENSPAKLKLASANKKLKEDFFKENEINKTAEIINDDFENDIDESFLQMEQTIGLTYESESDDGISSAQSNGNFNRRRAQESPSNSSSEAEDEGDAVAAKNTQLIESSVLQRKNDDHQAVNSIVLPFYERRRLSECKEESESDEDADEKSKPVIFVTTAQAGSEVAPKKRFTVTKANEVDHPTKQPVSILKKTPSPPSNQRAFLTHSPKKIRYEAAALKDVSAQKNSQTIHFPCTAAAIERANVKSFFSPQGFLNPHLDRRYFDSSLVEVRASQTLNDSSKSLDDKSPRPLDSNVWIKRKESKSSEDKISVSSDSIDKSSRVVGESVSLCSWLTSLLKML